MSDYTPGSYFPSEYFAPSYFGGGAVDPNAMLAALHATSTVSASISDGNARVTETPNIPVEVNIRGARKKRYYARLGDYEIIGSAEEVDAYIAAYLETEKLKKKLGVKTVSKPGKPVKKPRKVVATERVEAKATAPVEISRPDISALLNEIEALKAAAIAIREQDDELAILLSL